ncbi:acyltransferase [Bradyrhizobium sp. INPA01-394B]|uniref:Acyltransferase n=1 Tax=Bradyrhizobium campsiandrae TaxID=1729892 RepID=A0ABR7U988_9BRAD|nr:acyltransferase [Bradyrhizobium campsiandrae]MBC9876317.1 acyltransferase [Bradyrhizobium campsiandrae]MBC9980160.1 acyltransferase [Bradyrhizobium campsiandrae]
MRFDGIQIARAVAALSVLYFHSWTALVRFSADATYPLWPLARFGELGVDLFFGISGFVISMIAAKPGFRPLEFLVNRIFRIYPLWLLCLGTIAVLFAVWRGWQSSETLSYLLYSATLLPTHELPFYNIGWTLQHEITFYVLAAAIVPAFGLIGLLVVLVLSFVALGSAPWYLSNFAGFHLEFAAGILAYMLLPRLRWVGALLPIAAGVVGMCVLHFYLGHRGVAPALLLAIIGFANLNSDSSVSRFFVSMGDRSYSIYLLHPIVFWSFSSIVSLLIAKIPLWTAEPIRFTCMAIVIVAAGQTWVYVEQPTIRLGNRFAARLTRNAPTLTGASPSSAR